MSKWKPRVIRPYSPGKRRSASSYILYRTADGKTFEKFASTKDTHISVPTTDIYGYAVMIGTMKMGSDNKEYYSLKMTNGTPVKPVVAGNVRGESGKSRR